MGNSFSGLNIPEIPVEIWDMIITFMWKSEKNFIHGKIEDVFLENNRTEHNALVFISVCNHIRMVNKTFLTLFVQHSVWDTLHFNIIDLKLFGHHLTWRQLDPFIICFYKRQQLFIKQQIIKSKIFSCIPEQVELPSVFVRPRAGIQIRRMNLHVTSEEKEEEIELWIRSIIDQ
jgi:hypothetical protein